MQHAWHILPPRFAFSLFAFVPSPPPFPFSTSFFFFVFFCALFVFFCTYFFFFCTCFFFSCSCSRAHSLSAHVNHMCVTCNSYLKHMWRACVSHACCTNCFLTLRVFFRNEFWVFCLWSLGWCKFAVVLRPYLSCTPAGTRCHHECPCKQVRVKLGNPNPNPNPKP